jgi:CRP-like cAMP-binding protein
MISKNNSIKIPYTNGETLHGWTGKTHPLRQLEELSVKNFSVNHLFAAQNKELFIELLPFLERITLSGNEDLYQPDDLIDFVYFPETAIISEFQILEDGRTVEIAMTGREGVIGLLPIFNSMRATNWTQVSIGGSAFRISSRIFRNKLNQDHSCQQLLFDYINIYVGQISQRSVCNSYHMIEQRFCSWLLMLQNRKKSNNLPLTQEQIARFLGVHRPSVTQIAQILRTKKIIDYVRGNIHILNRLELEKLACACYSEIDQNSTKPSIFNNKDDKKVRSLVIN